MFFIYIHFKVDVKHQLASKHTSYCACPNIFVIPSYLYIFGLPVCYRSPTKELPMSKKTGLSN